MVVVGAKSYRDVVDAFEKLYPSLVEFRKVDETSTSNPEMSSLEDVAIQELLESPQHP